MALKLSCSQGLRLKTKFPGHIFIRLADVNYQWVSKESDRIDQMFGMIKQIPYRFNMFTGKGFAIYLLDDCAVSLMREIQQELCEKRYTLVIIDGGTTGDFQVTTF